jgi:dihydroorotate dehydrogenase
MKILSAGYRYAFKPIAFRFDPETVHDFVSASGKFLGKYSFGKRLVRGMFYYEHPQLRQTLAGVHFPNPIGLAAGFDKNAQLVDILPDVGFGFAEVGSITGQACAGNDRPRLWRMPKSKSLLVYYGLKNDGAEVVAQRLSGRTFRIPIGVSVAKTNNQACADTAVGAADYARAHRLLADIGAYTTVNISCPNTFGGQPFTDPGSLDMLLTEIDKIATQKPTFVKLSPDLSPEVVDALLEVMGRHRVQGIICSNLTKDHTRAQIRDTEVPEVGGFSGKVQEDLSNAQLAYVYRKTKGAYILVGCGGVFSAEDAYKKIRLGANLIQLITGMIFEGPGLIGDINRGLVELFRRDGFASVAEAVGADNK